MTSQPFADRAELEGQKFEWALTWLGPGEDGFSAPIAILFRPRPAARMKMAFARPLRAGCGPGGELAGNKRAAELTAEDILAGSAGILSVFLREPQFQGQTKDRLVSAEATRQTEAAVRDRFDLWLSSEPERANWLLEAAIERMSERKRRRKEKEVQRKTATRKLRLPGKLADCTSTDLDQTELFLVEGDSAGGSAKSTRNRADPGGAATAWQNPQCGKRDG